jgi:phospholipid/cholesterol/gamma-HCH transport system substrate-binding protein
MSESTSRQTVIVGLFVTFGMLILAGGILTIGNLNDTFTRKIAITAVFDNVNGLKEGDNIWFSGVKVGTVKNLDFVDGSQVEAELRIDRDAAQHIRKDALAKLSSDGLIGNKIIVLYGGTEQAPLIASGDVIAVGKTVSTEEIMEMVQENNKNLLAITGNIKTLTEGLTAGQGTAGKLLKDDALYSELTDTVASLKTTSHNAEGLTASLSSFAGKLNQPGSLPDDLVTDKEMYASLQSSVKSLQTVATNASALVDTLAKGAADPGTPIGTLMGDAEAGADLKVTLDNLSQSTHLLAEDLEAAQHNFLLRGFFKKKEKKGKGD